MKRWILMLLLLWSAAAHANCVVGATGVVGTGTCSQAGMILIAQQTASSSANLAFTGANFVNTYNRLQLLCTLVLSAAGNIYVDVGTGATPTWQQTSYGVSGIYFSYVNGSTMTVYGSANGEVSLVGGLGSDVAVPANLEITINNPGSTTYAKSAIWNVSQISGGAIGRNVGTGQWTGGATIPLTGLQVIPGSTGPGVGGLTFSTGECSLYGMP